MARPMQVAMQNRRHHLTKGRRGRDGRLWWNATVHGVLAAPTRRRRRLPPPQAQPAPPAPPSLVVAHPVNAEEEILEGGEPIPTTPTEAAEDDEQASAPELDADSISDDALDDAPSRHDDVNAERDMDGASGIGQDEEPPGPLPPPRAAADPRRNSGERRSNGEDLRIEEALAEHEASMAAVHREEDERAERVLAEWQVTRDATMRELGLL